MRYPQFLVPFAVVALGACMPPSHTAQTEAYSYDRVAEVTNAAAGDLDVFVSRSSGRTLLATLRPGETQRITIPAGSNGVWCQYANGSAVGTGCRVRYLDANES